MDAPALAAISTFHGPGVGHLHICYDCMVREPAGKGPHCLHSLAFYKGCTCFDPVGTPADRIPCNGKGPVKFEEIQRHLQDGLVHQDRIGDCRMLRFTVEIPLPARARFPNPENAAVPGGDAEVSRISRKGCCSGMDERYLQCTEFAGMLRISRT